MYKQETNSRRGSNGSLEGSSLAPPSPANEGSVRGPGATQMTGAESLVRTLIASGVEVCFANPGTSEMHFLGALDKVSGMRPVLGLFEGIVSGMADGYARVTGKPAATLLHLGSGLGNAVANLHNARRAASPVVNIVGDHASYHQCWDTPLKSDIASLAASVSGWVHTTASSHAVGGDAARAVAAACEKPGQVATLILPADAAWGASDGPALPLPRLGPARFDPAAIERVARILNERGPQAVLLARGDVLSGEGLRMLGRIATATGVCLMHDTLAPRIERGAGLPAVEKVPYRAEDMVTTFASVSDLIVLGTTPPVATFAYPQYPSWCLAEQTRITYLAQAHEDCSGAVEALADLLEVRTGNAYVASLELPAAPRGELDQFSIGRSVARHLPEGAIISEEAASSSAGPFAALATARPHVWLTNAGGAIGQGMPLATGSAIAAPDRKVVNLQADGSAMYTLQALWTQARENLDVVTVIFANRRYAILEQEFARVGGRLLGERGRSMLNIGDPAIDWVRLATSLGVAASHASTAEAFDKQFAKAMAERGPRLIEARI